MRAALIVILRILAIIVVFIGFVSSIVIYVTLRSVNETLFPMIVGLFGIFALFCVGKLKNASPIKMEGDKSLKIPLYTAMITNLIRIINESYVLIIKSSNLETVLSRFNLFLKTIDELIYYKFTRSILLGKNPEELRNQFGDPHNQFLILSNAFQRALDKECSEAQKLKTIKGKENRKKAFLKNAKVFVENAPVDLHIDLAQLEEMDWQNISI